MTTRETELGASFLGLQMALLAARSEGWRGPAIVHETDGWRVTVHRTNGTRRFPERIEALRSDPVDAMRDVTEQLIAI